MQPVADPTDLAETYASAVVEMADSPAYAHWAGAVARDEELLTLIAGWPVRLQQPNLVFAAVRWHHPDLVHADDPLPGLRRVLLGPGAAAVRDTAEQRATQTNEVRRLASLVPALGLLPAEPLALVELGSSAGLCLFPDAYDYRWEGPDGTVELTGSGGPVLTATTTGPVPVPTRHPVVAHRTGIDLAPVDLTDPDAVAWLENLVWPGQDDRLARLRDGIAVTRREPPTTLAGDMLERLDEALALAEASGARPVVQHSAAVAYLDAAARRRLVTRLGELVRSGRCHWLALEGPRVLDLPDVAGLTPPPDHGFVLSLDGRALAWAHGHGARLAWRG